MKIMSVIFAFVGVICLIFAIPLGIGGFSSFQSDRGLARYPAEVVSLRAEGAYVRPVVRYHFQGTDYQVILRDRDFYDGEKLNVIFRDDTPSSAEIYRDSPFLYGKVNAAINLAAAGIVFLAVSFFLLRIDKRMAGSNPLGFLPPLFFTLGIGAICVMIAVNVITYLPQNRDNEANFPQINATLVMVPETSGGTAFQGDTVAQYTYNAKTYKAKVSDSKDNYVGKEISLYIKYTDPGLAKEKLNDTTLLTVLTIVIAACSAGLIFFGILLKKRL